MKILLCSWADIFEPDVLYAFTQIGIYVDKFSEPISDFFTDNVYIKLLSEKLFSYDYDFVFSVNYIPVISMICNIHKIKYISWIVDSPCLELNSNTISNPINFIFIFDKTMYCTYKRKSPNTIHYLPLGSNIDRLDKIEITEKEKAQFKTDVSFIGSLYKSRSIYKTAQLPDYWYGYCESIIESQLCIYGYSILEDLVPQELIDIFIKNEKLDATAKEDNNNIYDFNLNNLIINKYIGFECSSRERIRIITKLSKRFQFHLYSIEDTSEFTFVQNKGMIEAFEDAFKVYKTSKINLNITSKTIKSGLPLRIYDILGAGGFLITNYQSELPEIFEINKDLVIYESIDDLMNKISYYLTHDEERSAIAKNGYLKVKTHYQLTSQLLKMLKVILDCN